MATSKGSFSLLYMVVALLSCASSLKEITKTGCGTTKGCFSMPASGCDSSKNCDYLVTYVKKNDQIEFEMSSKSKWAAIGFNSAGGKMVGTDAILCTTLTSGIAIQHYDLTSKSLPAKTSPTPTELTLNATSSEGGRTLCSFSRKITGSGKLKSLNQKWFLVVAHGPVSGDIPQYHGSEAKDKITSKSAIDLQSDFNVAAGESKMVLVKSHGTLMTIAWMCFVAIGIFMARYMKLMWADQLICGQKVWFVFHRTLVTLGVLFSVIAIILIFVHREGWSEGIGAHPYTGIITVALAIINPIMALFRPHPGEPKRPIFNWAHRCVGLTAFCLAVVTIFLAVFLKQLNIKETGLPVMITFCVGIFVVVIFDIVLYVRSQNKDSQFTPGAQGKGVEQMQEEQPTTNSTDNTIRFIAFGFWVLVAVATTVALAVIINVK